MAEETPSGKYNLTRLLNSFGPFLVLASVVVLFGVLLAWRDVADYGSQNSLGGWSGFLQAWKEAELAGFKTFFSLLNLKTVLTQTVIVAIGSLGMTMIIVSGGIDLSVGSAIALTSVLGAELLRDNHSTVMAVVITVASGGFIGAINGSLIAGFRMTPFIVTLGMLGMARGAAKWLAQNQTVNSPNIPHSSIANLMQDANMGIGQFPPGVVIAFILAVVMAVVMQRTIFGRHIFAVGSNEATARLCGIRTRWLKMWIYSLAGLFFGLAGLMQLSRLRQGDPTSAIGQELDMIAAVVIGGASLNGGTGSILGSMIGALTMAVLRTGSQYMDWPNYMQEIIIGLLIVLAVGLDKLRQSRLNS